MSKITSHVLDASRGKPAQGVPLVLERNADGKWVELSRASTNSDGRAPDLWSDGMKLETGIYRLTFDTQKYFESIGVRGFYPHVPIVFEIHDAGQHYHVPLLISPFSYSTYRGS
ncbi:MAG: hydroxyisourate hydrolase [Candidatus Obscuribacterales bacterium]|nr:hydroxyisourate hydrolase [Candidatus Obscuribacterales bacterium]